MISWSEDTGLQLGNNYPERIDPFSLVKIWILIFLTKPCILCRVFLEICFYVWIIIPDLIWGLFNWVSYIKNQSKKNYQSESKKLSQRGANECSRQKQANCPKSGKTRHQVETGVSFASDWLREWHEWAWPITERSKAKPKVISDVFRLSIENCAAARPSLIC